MSDYCVFYHDQKLHIYFIYHSDGKYEETVLIPNKKDSFEHSRLTKIFIGEQMILGKSLQNILKEYCDSILLWRNEIFNSKKLRKRFDYFQHSKKYDGNIFINTNESNIIRFFKYYSSKFNTEDKFDAITWKEYNWFEKTYNAGLLRCIDGECECLGYDHQMYYPNLLASNITIEGIKKQFYFPTKKGRETHVTSLNRLQYGLYCVKISSDNTDFPFIFQLNNNNVYTHYDIIFCKKYQLKYNIHIELLTDIEHNSLIFDTVLDGKEVFGIWLDRIKELKAEFPKNGLVKLLSSSIWGYLSKINKRHYNDVELNEHPEIKADYYDDETLTHLCLNEKDAKDGTVDYLLINKSNPYTKKYRLKSFLLSFGRIQLAEIGISIGVNKIVRINTDNITFNRKLLSEDDLLKLSTISPTFILECKTTGNFNIININNFDRLTE
jgi:hypothetical protein